MKQILDKLLKFISLSKDLGRQPYYIVEFNGLPVLIRRDDLKSGINRTYVVCRDRIYIEKTPIELKSVEMLRAEEKLSVQDKVSTGES